MQVGPNIIRLDGDSAIDSGEAIVPPVSSEAAPKPYCKSEDGAVETEAGPATELHAQQDIQIPSNEFEASFGTRELDCRRSDGTNAALRKMTYFESGNALSKPSENAAGNTYDAGNASAVGGCNSVEHDVGPEGRAELVIYEIDSPCSTPEAECSSSSRESPSSDASALGVLADALVDASADAAVDDSTASTLLPVSPQASASPGFKHVLLSSGATRQRLSSPGPNLPVGGKKPQRKKFVPASGKSRRLLSPIGGALSDWELNNGQVQFLSKVRNERGWLRKIYEVLSGRIDGHGSIKWAKINVATASSRAASEGRNSGDDYGIAFNQKFVDNFGHGVMFKSAHLKSVRHQFTELTFYHADTQREGDVMWYVYSVLGLSDSMPWDEFVDAVCASVKRKWTAPGYRTARLTELRREPKDNGRIIVDPDDLNCLVRKGNTQPEQLSPNPKRFRKKVTTVNTLAMKPVSGQWRSAELHQGFGEGYTVDTVDDIEIGATASEPPTEPPATLEFTSIDGAEIASFSLVSDWHLSALESQALRGMLALRSARSAPGEAEFDTSSWFQKARKPKKHVEEAKPKPPCVPRAKSRWVYDPDLYSRPGYSSTAAQRSVRATLNSDTLPESPNPVQRSFVAHKRQLDDGAWTAGRGNSAAKQVRSRSQAGPDSDRDVNEDESEENDEEQNGNGNCHTADSYIGRRVKLPGKGLGTVIAARSNGWLKIEPLDDPGSERHLRRTSIELLRDDDSAENDDDDDDDDNKDTAAVDPRSCSVCTFRNKSSYALKCAMCEAPFARPAALGQAAAASQMVRSKQKSKKKPKPTPTPKLKPPMSSTIASNTGCGTYPELVLKTGQYLRPNKRDQSASYSQYKGVTRNLQRGTAEDRWTARISVGDKLVILGGAYTSELEAAIAYAQAARGCL